MIATLSRTSFAWGFAALNLVSPSCAAPPVWTTVLNAHDLQTAIHAGNAAIKLGADIDLNTSIVVNQTNATIDGQGFHPGRATGQYLNGVCVGKIDGFSWCRQKPTSPCPFSSERPVFDSSRRETASPGGGSSHLFRFLFSPFFSSRRTPSRL